MKMGTKEVVKYYQSGMGTWVLPSLSPGSCGSSGCAELGLGAAAAPQGSGLVPGGPGRCCGLPSSLLMSPNPRGYHLWLGTAARGRGRLPCAPTRRGVNPCPSQRCILKTYLEEIQLPALTSLLSSALQPPTVPCKPL